MQLVSIKLLMNQLRVTITALALSVVVACALFIINRMLCQLIGTSSLLFSFFELSWLVLVLVRKSCFHLLAALQTAFPNFGKVIWVALILVFGIIPASIYLKLVYQYVISGRLLSRLQKCYSAVVGKGNQKLLVFHTVIYLSAFGVYVIAKEVQRDKVQHLNWINKGTGKVEDTLFGYSYPPFGSRYEASLVDGKVIASAHYNFDKFGRRVCPHDSLRNKAVLFFGCSFTYGEGVEDWQTIPSYYFYCDSTSNVYNYAVHGYGTQQTLMQLQRKNWEGQIMEDSVAAVYVYIRDHINRLLGKPVWAYNFPYYYVERDSVKYKGSFAHGWAWQKKLSYHLKNADIIPPDSYSYNYTANEYETEARVIEECRRVFEQKFRSKNFYVLLYPNEAGDLKKYLNRYPLRVLDYEKLLPLGDDYIIHNFNHPTPKANDSVAKCLARDLRAKGW